MGRICGMDKAIEIVKAGGADELQIRHQNPMHRAVQAYKHLCMDERAEAEGKRYIQSKNMRTGQ